MLDRLPEELLVRHVYPWLYNSEDVRAVVGCCGVLWRRDHWVLDAYHERPLTLQGIQYRATELSWCYPDCVHDLFQHCCATNMLSSAQWLIKRYPIINASLGLDKAIRAIHGFDVMRWLLDQCYCTMHERWTTHRFGNKYRGVSVLEVVQDPRVAQWLDTMHPFERDDFMIGDGMPLCVAVDTRNLSMLYWLMTRFDYVYPYGKKDASCIIMCVLRRSKWLEAYQLVHEIYKIQPSWLESRHENSRHTVLVELFDGTHDNVIRWLVQSNIISVSNAVHWALRGNGEDGLLRLSVWLLRQMPHQPIRDTRYLNARMQNVVRLHNASVRIGNSQARPDTNRHQNVELTLQRHPNLPGQRVDAVDIVAWTRNHPH